METKELRKSISPLTHQEYLIPELLDDKQQIDQFIAKNAGKKIVAVQGLGFVGAVMSIVVANAPFEEYAVIGVDLPSEGSYWKIQSINEGLFPVIADDPKIATFYENARKKENFLATFDAYAFSKADVIIVDINLDVDKQSNEVNDLEGYDVDLTGFKGAMKMIGKNCKKEALILVETTVPVGTCQKIVRPIILESLKERGLSQEEIFIGHSYERVMPGPKYVDSIQNFYRVYSGVDDKSADATEKFLRTVIHTDEYPLTRLGSTNATEMAKVLENSFRAMNIAFIVEWSRFAEEAGVNLYEVVKAIRMRPTHKNIMLPGLGVGGYCLTKDPLLASWSKQNLFDSDQGLGQSERGVQINDKMPAYAFEFLSKSFNAPLENKNILLCGVSYLNDVGDTRYTPVDLLFELLSKAQSKLALHDPHVSYWEEKKLNIEVDIDILLKADYDVIIICTGHKHYRSQQFVDQLLNRNRTFIYDTIGVFSEDSLQQLNQVHTIKILGRGDY